MPSKRFLLALAALAALPPAATAQGISAKELEAKLGADVSRWGNDGRLTIRWAFESRDELKAFDLEGPKPRIGSEGGLALKAGGAAILRELHFQAPVKIELDVRLASASDAPVLLFVDGEDEGVKTVAFVNSRIYSNSDKRFDGAYFSRHEEADVGQSFTASGISAAAALTVSFDVSATGMQMRIGGATVWKQGAWPHKSFRLALGAREGTPSIRGLRIDGAVVVESMRKLANALEAGAGAAKARSGAFKGAVASVLIEAEIAAEEGVSSACEAAFDELPEPLVQRQQRAMKAASKGDLAGARSSLEECVRDRPESPVLHWSLGRILEAEDRTEAAIEAYRAAIARSTGIPEVYRDLGRLLLEAGRPDEAAGHLAKARELDPADPWVHVSLALLQLGRLDLEAAEKEVAAAREKRPASKGLRLFAEDIGRLRSKPKWGRKPHLEKKGDYLVEGDIAPKDIAAIASKLLYYRRFLETAFPHGVKQAEPCRVWIFDSEEAYHVFGDTLARREDRSVGLYHPHIRTLLLFGKVSPKETQEVLFHEAFHQYLDVAVRHAPIWFNEGLAEYFGATTFDGAWKPVEGGLQPKRLGHLRSLLDERPPVDFQELMLMSPARFMDGDAGLHYAQSWAMVHWFLRGGHAAATRAFHLYRDAVLAGKPPRACFEATFGAADAPPLSTLQSAFLGYLKGL